MGRAAPATVVQAGAGAPFSPERSSHRLMSTGPRSPRNFQPGGGPVHPDRRSRLLTVCRPGGRTVPATANRAGDRCTPIAGAVIAPHGSQRAAAAFRVCPDGRLELEKPWFAQTDFLMTNPGSPAYPCIALRKSIVSSFVLGVYFVIWFLALISATLLSILACLANTLLYC